MAGITRRRFLQYGAGISAALTMPWAQPSAAFAAMGGKLGKYLEQVPLPGNGIVVATPTGPNQYAFTQTGTPLSVSFTNNLAGSYPAWIPVDTRLTPLGSQVRVMTHLHGGFVAADSDGNPAITPDGFGPDDTQVVHYPNEAPQMPASLLWFHDHGLGATRLNVFAGLAAAYRPRRVRHRRRTEPDRDPRRTVRDPAGCPGPAVQPGRDVPLPEQRVPGCALDRRVLRRRDARQRQGLAVPERRAAPVSAAGPE